MSEQTQTRSNVPNHGSVQGHGHVTVPAGQPINISVGVAERAPILPRSAVRNLSFGIMALGLMACACFCIYAIWIEGVKDVMWRALATYGVIGATTLGFNIINEAFGYRPDRNDDRHPNRS